MGLKCDSVLQNYNIILGNYAILFSIHCHRFRFKMFCINKSFHLMYLFIDSFEEGNQCAKCIKQIMLLNRDTLPVICSIFTALSRQSLNFSGDFG